MKRIWLTNMVLIKYIWCPIYLGIYRYIDIFYGILYYYTLYPFWGERHLVPLDPEPNHFKIGLKQGRGWGKHG
jgi:hypothetical protein